MTSEPCRDMRADLAAAAIGRIDPADDVALRAHLDGCAACRTELRSLTSAARALPLAEADRLDDARRQPSSELGDRVVARLARLGTAQRRRARRRVTLTATTTVALAAAVALVVLVIAGPQTSGTTVEFPPAAGASGRATLSAQATGTEIALYASGLEAGEVYWLWLTGDDGKRVTAGTFEATPQPINVTMTAALGLDDTRRIWLTDASDAVVLDSTVPGG